MATGCLQSLVTRRSSGGSNGSSVSVIVALGFWEATSTAAEGLCSQLRTTIFVHLQQADGGARSNTCAGHRGQGKLFERAVCAGHGHTAVALHGIILASGHQRHWPWQRWRKLVKSTRSWASWGHFKRSDPTKHAAGAAWVCLACNREGRATGREGLWPAERLRARQVGCRPSVSVQRT